MLEHLARFPFTAWAISGAPEDPGIYALWRGGELVFIGYASGSDNSIRSRLIEHFSLYTDEGEHIATDYMWELSRNPKEREAELLQEYEQVYGRLPRLNRSSPDIIDAERARKGL